MLFDSKEWPRGWLARLPRLIPSSCALCGAVHAEAICDACRIQYFSKVRHRCRRCAAALPDAGANVCGACLAQPPAFDATVAATDYLPPVDQLVLALKFGSRLALAPLFAQLLHDALLRACEAQPDMMIAIPLGARRLRERGFNQALEIAKPLARRLDIALMPQLLLRQRDTRAQSQLHWKDRHANLRQAFSVHPRRQASAQGKHIAVVDDVMTTGETLNEAATTLKRFGATRVTNLVLARTLPK